MLAIAIHGISCTSLCIIRSASKFDKNIKSYIYPGQVMFSSVLFSLVTSACMYTKMQIGSALARLALPMPCCSNSMNDCVMLYLHNVLMFIKLWCNPNMHIIDPISVMLWPNSTSSQNYFIWISNNPYIALFPQHSESVVLMTFVAVVTRVRTAIWKWGTERQSIAKWKALVARQVLKKATNLCSNQGVCGATKC